MNEKELERWLDRMEVKQADQAKNLDRLEASLERLLDARMRLVAAQKRNHGLIERAYGLPPSRPDLRLVDAQVETDLMARATARTRRSRREPPAKS